MRYTSKTHVQLFNPTVGDFVVVIRTWEPCTNISTNWVRLRRITKILLDYTVKVEHLLSGTTSVVHGSRIRQYMDSLVNSVATKLSIAKQSDCVWFAIERARDIRLINGKPEILVFCKFLRDSGDTWEPFEMVYEDVEPVICSFLLLTGNTEKIRTFMQPSAYSLLWRDSSAAIHKWLPTACTRYCYSFLIIRLTQ